MKSLQTSLLLLSLVVFANANVLSVSKRSVTDNPIMANENVLNIRKTMKTLNITIGKFFQQLEDDPQMTMLECEEDFGLHSIFKRSAESNDEDVVSIETMMKTLNTTLENVFKKLDECLSKRPSTALNCKDIEEPKNCAEVLHKCDEKRSGVYKINPDGKGAFKVYCDQQTDGGGWTVFQRRKDGSVDFYRGWDDYKNGFGNLHGEFWLGLDKIYRLTNKTQKGLRIDLEDHEGNTRYAEYDYFAVADEADKYRLEVQNCTGTAGNSLLFHRGQPFTTKDRDNDVHKQNCGVIREGAWWFKKCMLSHLNGAYYQSPKVDYAQGINWYCWKDDYYSLKKADMKLRPRDARTKKKINEPYVLQCPVFYPPHNPDLLRPRGPIPLPPRG